MVNASDRADRPRARRHARARDRAAGAGHASPGSRASPADDEMFLGFTSFTDARARRTGTTSRRAAPDALRGGLGQRRPARLRGRARSSSRRRTARGSRCSWSTGGAWPRTEAARVLLTGYGGFNISLTPAFDPSRLRAGSSAAASSPWPTCAGAASTARPGTRRACWTASRTSSTTSSPRAEWLVASGYTRAREAGDPGREQRRPAGGRGDDAAPGPGRAPCVCQVPVADMLRYHLFTVGRFWIPEYGSADDPDAVPVPAAATRRTTTCKDGVPLSGHPHHDRRHGRPRVARAWPRSSAPRLQAAHGGRRAHPGPGGDEGGPRRGQADLEADRRAGGHLPLPLLAARGRPRSYRLPTQYPRRASIRPDLPRSFSSRRCQPGLRPACGS